MSDYNRTSRLSAIQRVQADILRDLLDAIDATETMRTMIAQIWRSAGFRHAMKTIGGWAGEQ